MSTHPSLAAGALTLRLLFASSCVQGENDKGDGSPAASHPDVFLIVADTLRADHLDLYGYSMRKMKRKHEFQSVDEHTFIRRKK